MSRRQPGYCPFSLRMRVQWRVLLVLAAVFLCVGKAWSYSPSDTVYLNQCASPAAENGPWEACTGPHDIVQQDFASPDVLLVACPASSSAISGWQTEEPDGGCDWAWRFPASMAPGTAVLVYDGSTDSNGWLPYSALRFVNASAPSGGGGSGGFDVSSLDSPELAAAWAAGFTIMALSYVIGFGFRALLDMIRRG